MKKIIILSAVICSLSNNAFCMLPKRIAMSNVAKKNSINIRECNRRTQFNRTELLQQLKEEQHRFTPEQMTYLKTLITNQSKELTEERIAMPGKAKDRDFEHGNMNKE